VGVRRPVSGRRIAAAIFGAAFAGWFTLVAATLFPAVVEGEFAEAISGLVLLALFGLPLALILSLLVGTPLVLLALRLGWTGPIAALLLGSLCGLVIGALLLAKQLVGSSGSFGGAEGWLWLDGWPTSLGWKYELRNLALYGLAGAVAGSVARIVGIQRT
jgi:hypothetical protein